jgi:hypothetical protein
MREQMTVMLAPKIKTLFKSLYDSAVGLTMMEETEEGEERVYSKAPDTKAAQLLLSYGLGSPQDSVDPGGALSLFMILKQMQDGDNSKNN